jgi:hypothetical protein
MVKRPGGRVVGAVLGAVVDGTVLDAEVEGPDVVDVLDGGGVAVPAALATASPPPHAANHSSAIRSATRWALRSRARSGVVLVVVVERAVLGGEVGELVVVGRLDVPVAVLGQEGARTLLLQLARLFEAAMSTLLHGPAPNGRGTACPP